MKQQGPPEGIPTCNLQQGHPAVTATWATTEAEVPTTPPWEFMPLQSTSNYKPPCPQPRFVKIAQALQGEEPMKVASCQPLLASHARKS